MSDQVTTLDEVVGVLRRSASPAKPTSGIEYPTSVDASDIEIEIAPERVGNQSEGQRLARIATHSGLTDVPPLHNPKPPTNGVIHEKPEHRLVALLVAQGFSAREIAEKSGYGESHIATLKGQIWFQQLVAHELNVAGRVGVIQMLERATAESVLKLIELRDGASNPAVQLNAAKDLLDRVLGKPTQHIEQKTRIYTSAEEELRALDEQLAQLKQTIT